MAKANDVAVTEVIPSVDLAGINDFDAALAAMQDAGITVERISDYGDGFVLLPSADKGTLVKVAFLIVDGTFRTDKDTGREYLSLRIMTADGRKLIVNDGSVGLFQQAQAMIAKRGSLAGLVVPEGLSGGEYTTEINGQIVKASTFYFTGL